MNQDTKDRQHIESYSLDRLIPTHYCFIFIIYYYKGLDLSKNKNKNTYIIHKCKS